MNLHLLQLTQDIGQGAAKATPKSAASVAAAHKAAQSFEEMFISELLNSMPSGTDPNGPFGGGQAESMYHGMLNDQYAKTITKNGGIGIADSLQREILKMQEAQHAGSK